MYDNITNELRSIIEPRLDVFYLTEKNFCLKSLFYKDIDSLNFDIFSNQKTIVFLLDDNFEDLSYTDNLRKLLCSSLVFTNNNLFKRFGVPERFFTFNALVDEKEYYIFNNGSRTISADNYVYEKNYSGAMLNDTTKIIFPQITIIKQNKNKIFADILKCLSCGCNVYINELSIIDLFSEDIKVFFNKDLSDKDKLDAQFIVHKNYSYIVQVNYIEEQLYGIYGSKYDLVVQS